MKYLPIKEQLEDIFLPQPKRNNEIYNHANDYINDKLNTGYWCLTNMHVALMVPHEHIGKAGCADIRYDEVLKTLVKKEHQIIISYSQIKSVLSTCGTKPEVIYTYTKCEKCQGEGDIYCSCCDNTNECNKCGGDGEVLESKRETGRIIYEAGPLEDKEIIKLSDAYFDPNILQKLLYAIELMELTEAEISLTHGSSKTGNVFCFGDVKLIVMPWDYSNKLTNCAVKEVL
jgi:hypothetical protein